MPSTGTFAPVTLEGDVVRLVPMTIEHVPALFEAGRFPELWALTTIRVANEADMHAYVKEALADQEAGVAMPFVTTLRATGAVIGSTRFGNWTPAHCRVEIGWTWITPSMQRSAVNTQAKRLMLGHAFDVLGCRRVELKTSALNSTSRNAMLRIGAREEGTMRKHMINADGSPRDSVYYSVVDDEWPAVREHLDALGARYRRP